MVISLLAFVLLIPNHIALVGCVLRLSVGFVIRDRPRVVIASAGQKNERRSSASRITRRLMVAVTVTAIPDANRSGVRCSDARSRPTARRSACGPVRSRHAINTERIRTGLCDRRAVGDRARGNCANGEGMASTARERHRARRPAGAPPPPPPRCACTAGGTASSAIVSKPNSHLALMASLPALHPSDAPNCPVVAAALHPFTAVRAANYSFSLGVQWVWEAWAWLILARRWQRVTGSKSPGPPTSAVSNCLGYWLCAW